MRLKDYLEPMTLEIRYKLINSIGFSFIFIVFIHTFYYASYIFSCGFRLIQISITLWAMWGFFRMCEFSLGEVSRMQTLVQADTSSAICAHVSV